MGVEALIGILIWVIVLLIIAYVAYYIINTFFPEPIRTPALLVVGLLLLLVILYAIVGGGPGLRIPAR